MLLAGLTILKNTFNMWGHALRDCWAKTPYHHFFCDAEFLHHEAQRSWSSMTRCL